MVISNTSNVPPTNQWVMVTNLILKFIHGVLQKSNVPHWVSHNFLECNMRDEIFYAWEDLSSTVIRLPNLEELKLKRCQFWNNRWSLRANDKVQSLKLLLLSDLYLDVWEASSDNFPKLKRLVLKNCENLQEVSLDFGEIGTLGSIELHDCSTTVEDSARKIEQEQEDMGNNSLKGIEAYFEGPSTDVFQMQNLLGC
ncbi:hypothetical protein BC332_03244 [Capsicum chinense]|nr:hypothetical protein BC332_03244 [Capsicum chinense]